MTDKWGLEKLLNAARVTRACQRLFKKKKKEENLTNYSASCMQMCELVRAVWGLVLCFFLLAFFFFFSPPFFRF